MNKNFDFNNKLVGDSFTTKIDYNSIEVFSKDDEVVKESFQRPQINLYNEIIYLNHIENQINNSLGFKDGIYNNDFYINKNTDIKTFSLTRNNNTTINKHYLRLTPGSFFINGKNIIKKPNITVTERQIKRITNQEVKINYFDNTDKFQIKIGDSVIGDVFFGDSMTGFDSGLEMLYSIYSRIRTTVNENIENIELEDVIVLTGGDSIYVGFDENFNLVGDTYSVFFPFYHVKTNLINQKINLESFEDLRIYNKGRFLNPKIIDYNIFSFDGSIFLENGNFSTSTDGFGDSYSINIRTTGNSIFYFHSSNNNRNNLYNLEKENNYRFSIRIKNGNDNISFVLFEYFSNSIKETITRGRNISNWQELIINKKIEKNITGIGLALRINGINNFLIDDFDVQRMSVIKKEKNIIIRNITGDTFSINNIRADGDSEITFSNKVRGDTLDFNVLELDRFINKIDGDTLNIDTLLVDNIKNDGDINLLNKIVGDTLNINTLDVNRFNYRMRPSLRRGTVKNITGNYTISSADEGKIINYIGTNRATITVPVLTSEENYMYFYIINFSNSDITVIYQNEGYETRYFRGRPYQVRLRLSNRQLEHPREGYKFKYIRNSWIIISFFHDDVFPVDEGGTNASTIEDIKNNTLRGVLTESEGDSKYALSSHTHSEYISEIPSIYLSQNEGNNLFYNKTLLDNEITSFKNSLINNAPSNLNTLSKISNSINNNSNLGDSINNKINNLYSILQGDSLYRNEIIYNRDLNIIPNRVFFDKTFFVNNFEPRDYRWIKFIYRIGNERFTTKLRSSDFLVSNERSAKEIYTTDSRSNFKIWRNISDPNNYIRVRVVGRGAVYRNENYFVDITEEVSTPNPPITQYRITGDTHVGTQIKFPCDAFSLDGSSVVAGTVTRTRFDPTNWYNSRNEAISNSQRVENVRATGNSEGFRRGETSIPGCILRQAAPNIRGIYVVPDYYTSRYRFLLQTRQVQQPPTITYTTRQEQRTRQVEILPAHIPQTITIENIVGIP